LDADRVLAAGFVAALLVLVAVAFGAALEAVFVAALAVAFGADFAAAVGVAAAAAFAAVLAVAFAGRLPLAPVFPAMDVSSLTVTEHRVDFVRNQQASTQSRSRRATHGSHFGHDSYDVDHVSAAPADGRGAAVARRSG
jgi:hypothetical protein